MILAAFLVAVLASAMPLLIAAVGETVGEQAGVLNVGLEGVLLVGGYFAFVATLSTGSFWLGFLAGALAGVVLAACMMVLSVWLGANQIVVGIGMTLAGTGVSSMLYDWAYSDSRPRLGAPPAWLAQLAPLAVLALVVCVSLWLHRTAPGLRLRVAGQRPAALDAAGGSVVRVRSLAVLFGGAVAGVAGAYLALLSAGTFTPGMTHGLGFLAIVAAMLARGRLLVLAVISLAYGLFVAAGTALQLAGVSVPNDVSTMAPFALVLVLLALFGRRAGLPPALAAPYVRGAR